MVLLSPDIVSFSRHTFIHIWTQVLPSCHCCIWQPMVQLGRTRTIGT